MKKTLILIIGLAFIAGEALTQGRNIIYFSGLKHRDNNFKGYNGAIHDFFVDVDAFYVGQLDENAGIEANTIQANERLINIHGMSSITDQHDQMNMAIGSSYGGISARMLEKMYQNSSEESVKIGGIITMGTPHQGAIIMNKRENGEAGEFAYETCYLLIGSIVTAIDAVVPDLVFGNPSVSQAIFATTFDPDAGEGGTNMHGICELMVAIAAPPKTTAYEERVGSPVLDDLNAYETNKPIVSIYGEESSPLFWRFVRQGVYPPVNAPHLAYEDKGDKWEKNARGFYKAAKTVINIHQGLAIINPLWWPKIGKLGRANDALKEALRWFDNHEAAYSHLIGAVGYEPVTHIIPDVYLCEDQLDALEAELQNAMYNSTDIAPILTEMSQIMADPDCYGDAEVVYYEHFSTSSDGGIAMPAMQYDGPLALNLPAKDAGHGESMNHPNVWAHLDNLFNGELGALTSPPPPGEFNFFQLIQ